MIIKRMGYGQYKKHYADCKTVSGSYNKAHKTIEVMIPDGRMKPSGVRGKKIRYFTFNGIEISTQETISITMRATCIENAIKRLPTDCVWNI